MSLSARISAKAESSGIAHRLLDAAIRFLFRRAAGLGAALLVGFVTLVCVASAKFPHANWDLLPYVAASAEQKIAQPAELHRYAYNAVKASVDPLEYEALVTGNAYRLRQANDAAAFTSMLPMYRVKTLYVSLISALSPYAGEVGAMRLISLVSVLATGLCVGLWLYREQAFALAPVAVGALMVLGYADAGRLGSPDALFMAMFTFGLYALYRKHEAVAALALFLSFMVRSDTIIFLGILALMFAAFKVMSAAAFVSFIAAAAAYAFLSDSAGHPGWWTHFWFSNVEQRLTMQGFEPAFSIAVYARSLASGAVRAATEQAWPGILVMLCAIWAFARGALPSSMDRGQLIFCALIAGIGARFVLFPLPDARLHSAYLIAATMISLPWLKTLLSVWTTPRV